jgi:chromosomal replication initiator protein
VTESVDVLASQSSHFHTSTPGFARGEIATLTCDRCRSSGLPWELRTFGDKSICAVCYGATVDLGRAAIKVMPTDERNRACSSCQAMRNPRLGSAWCAVTELGDERARICANFVPFAMDVARGSVTGGRVDVLDLWQSISDEIRSTLGDGNYATWFAGVEPISVDETTLVLSVPDEYTRASLVGRFSSVIQHALGVHGHSHLSPSYTLDSAPAAAPPTPAAEMVEAKIGFNPHYSFSEFVVGSGNRLAHASALACVDKPGTAYNPLFLYGGVGVGKTHLLQAIGQEAIDQGKGNVVFATSEAFTNELIHAIRDGSTGTFRERYRNADYLLLDDVQFIAGKEATQEEFFHTFNELHGAGKQIVLTSDRPPGELRILEARLRSRFEWGLSADMQPPDFETRMAIIRTKANARHRHIPETVLNALATRAGSNVRELEGALNRVLALSDLLGTEPGMEIVRSVLGEPESESGSCRPADVLQAVSAYYRVKTSELSGPQRERRISYARQIAMFLLREEVKLSLIEVGTHLGGRNHSTVIYSCDKIGESKNKGRVKQDLQAIKQLMYSVR